MKQKHQRMMVKNVDLSNCGMEPPFPRSQLLTHKIQTRVVPNSQGCYMGGLNYYLKN